ncbi:MAG: four helix bundle protein [Saprospiraceae bacterium]
MAKTFEELDVYKLSCEINKDIWTLRSSIKSESPGTWHQLDRSAGSISDNIAEGFGRETRPDFKNFLRYSKGSAMEAQSQINRCMDRELIDARTASTIIKKLRRVTVMITSFQRYLAQNRLKQEPLQNLIFHMVLKPNLF